MSLVNPDPLTLMTFSSMKIIYTHHLLDNGDLRFGNKSDLLMCFESNTWPVSDSPPADTKILNGPATVHILLHKGSKTFKDFATQIFVPYIRKQF